MDKMDLWKKASFLREKMGENDSSPVDVVSLALALENLTLVYYPMGSHLSGMCIKNPDVMLIAINSEMTLGRQRFSLAHELYHQFFDDTQLTALCAAQIGIGSAKERAADQFASYFLMPPQALSKLIWQCKGSQGRPLQIEDVVRIEQYFQVSRQAVLVRLVDEHELTKQEADSMRKNVIQSARKLGYTDALYKPSPQEKQYGTYGYYIKQADVVLDNHLISNGKYEELLLNAYRADIVYGSAEEEGEILD